MKRFMEWTVQFKFVWSLAFATALLLYVMIGMAFGQKSMEFIVIWQLVLVTTILTAVYYLFFAELVLNSLSMKLKVVLHGLISYIILMGFAHIFNWISIFNPSNLIYSTLGYIVLHLSFVLSFYMYYKATGEELNDKLASYKEKRNVKK
jgi:hypothetical protein